MYFHLLGVAGRDGLVCIKQQAQLTGIMAVGEAAVLSCKWQGPWLRRVLVEGMLPMTFWCDASRGEVAHGTSLWWPAAQHQLLSLT